LIEYAERISDRMVLTPSDGGLHLLGRLTGQKDDAEIANRALQRGIHVWPLSIHSYRIDQAPALLLGYAGTTERDSRTGIEILDSELGKRRGFNAENGNRHFAG
jgi:GntR family transcriptional regulator/MocR family aminotransferase